jgi:hypothetical protein
MKCLCFILLLCSCDSPIPLPPTVRHHERTNGQMVKLGELEGYLARPLGTDAHEALLMRVEQIDPSTRASVVDNPKVTVFMITLDQDVSTARQYLQGLDGVTSVRTLCKAVECP